MAKIGSVKLTMAEMKGNKTRVEVMYDITFSKKDQQAKQAYMEVCRLIGDDTGTGDPEAAGPDDTLGFLTPMFNKKTTPRGDDLTVTRHLKKTFRNPDIDEDRAQIPNPDEFRALVTLTPLPRGSGEPIRRESPVVKRSIS